MNTDTKHFIHFLRANLDPQPVGSRCSSWFPATSKGQWNGKHRSKWHQSEARLGMRGAMAGDFGLLGGVVTAPKSEGWMDVKLVDMELSVMTGPSHHPFRCYVPFIINILSTNQLWGLPPLKPPRRGAQLWNGLWHHLILEFPQPQRSERMAGIWPVQSNISLGMVGIGFVEVYVDVYS